MSVAVPSAKVREPKLAPAAAPAPEQARGAPPASAAAGPAVYWGDRFAVRLWFAGAGTLAVLHLVEWLYRALRP